jgi:hypothetical protein
MVCDPSHCVLGFVARVGFAEVGTVASMRRPAARQIPGVRKPCQVLNVDGFFTSVKLVVIPVFATVSLGMQQVRPVEITGPIVSVDNAL